MTQVTELPIVKEVMTLLKLGDAGKVGAFYARQKTVAEKAIRDLNRNLITLENTFKDTLEDLEDVEKDLEENLEAAYLNVVPEKIQTRKDRESFEKVYWEDIKNVQYLLKANKLRIKDTKEKYEKDKKETETQISRYQSRIDRFMEIK